MRRVFSTLVAILLVLALAVASAGCGSTGKDGGSQTTVETTKAAAGTESSTSGTTERKVDISKTVNIRMVSFGNPPGDLPLVNDEVNKMIAKDLNATVSIEPLGMADWRTKYNLMLTSGEPVDIIWTANWNNYTGNALKGAYLPLDDLLANAAPGLYNAFPKEVWNMTRVNGKIYALPTTSTAFDEWGFLYREDLRMKYGLPEVTDLETIEAYLEGIKKNDSTIQPVIDTPEVGAFHSYFNINHVYNKFGATQFSYGIGINTDNPREVFNYIKTPQFKEYCTMVKRWVDKGLLRSDILSSKEDAWEGVRSGKYASTIASSDPGRLNPNVIVPSANEHPDWKFGYIHWGELGKQSYKMHATFFTFGLSKTSKNPERAIMFMEKAILDKDLNRLMDNGIEGKHYKVDENGYYVSLEGSSPKFAQSSAGTSPISYYKDNKLYTKSYQFVLDVFDTLAPYEVPNIFQGFAEDYDAYNAERAAIGQVWTQYGLPLIAGIVPDVEKGLGTLKEKMETAGSEKIYEEFSKQWAKYMDSLGVK